MGVTKKTNTKIKALAKNKCYISQTKMATPMFLLILFLIGKILDRIILVVVIFPEILMFFLEKLVKYCGKFDLISSYPHCLLNPSRF